MNRNDGRSLGPRHRFESQDDFGYLTGRHTNEDAERQIKSPDHSRRDSQREEYRRNRQTKDQKS